MDIPSQIMMTILMLMMLAWVIIAYVRQHRILKEMKRADKAKENRLKKV